MDPAVKASVLWGLIGAFVFLVALQAYHIVAGEFVGIEVMLGVAAVVLVVTTIATHVLRPVVAHRNERT